MNDEYVTLREPDGFSLWICKEVAMRYGLSSGDTVPGHRLVELLRDNNTEMMARCELQMAINDFNEKDKIDAFNY